MNIINEYIDGKKEEMIEFLSRLVEIPSEKGAASDSAPFGEENKKVLELFLDHAKKLGLFTENLENYAGYVETKKTDEPDIGLLCHLDVVPAGDGWTTPPYKADIRGGRIYGRGTTDDKGPAVAALYAIAAVQSFAKQEQDFHLTNKSIRLILGCDEESGWGDMAYYVKHAKMPKMGFSPDADFPVCNAEKGLIHLVLEKKNVSFGGVTVNGGERVNIIPELCKISGAGDLSATAKEAGVEGRYENGAFCVLGKAAHGSLPHLGKNAIVDALKLCKSLDCGEITEESKKLLQVLGTSDGIGLGIKCEDKQSGALTASMDMLTMDENGIKAAVDIRYPVTMDGEKLIDSIMQAAGDYEVTIKNHQKPLYISEDEPFIKCLLDAYTSVSGKEGKCFSMGGATFARTLPFGVAFGPTFPDSPDACIHTTDESIGVDELMMSAKIYAQAIINLCNI
ncbi:MAG: M20 family metallopeptidase [Ruminococcaceae bacterium]|nr:M20 family metallopeptidase [Oscillospiraceae bacterium]